MNRLRNLILEESETDDEELKLDKPQILFDDTDDEPRVADPLPKRTVEINIPASSDIYVSPPTEDEKWNIIHKFCGEVADVVEKMIESNVDLRAVFPNQIYWKSEKMHEEIFNFMVDKIDRV